MFVYIKISILIILFLISFRGNCQTTSRLTISSEGETLFLNFNSFDKYKNGISLSTIASVYFVDPLVPGLRWELDVKANSPIIIGENGNTLPLSTIEIVASGTENPTANYYTVNLAPSDFVLIDNGSQTDANGHLIIITYNIGTNTSLLGSIPDYYFVDIIYTLQPD